MDRLFLARNDRQPRKPRAKRRRNTSSITSAPNSSPATTDELTVDHLQDAMVALDVGEHVAHPHVLASGGVQWFRLVDLPSQPAAWRVAVVSA